MPEWKQRAAFRPAPSQASVSCCRGYRGLISLDPPSSIAGRLRVLGSSVVILFDNPYITVRHDEAKATVWVERSSVTSSDTATAAEVLAGIEKALVQVVPSKSTLV